MHLMCSFVYRDTCCASDFLFLCGQEQTAVWTGDWVTAQDWQAGLMRGREAPRWPCHDGINREWTSEDEFVAEWRIKRPHSAPLPRWVSAPSAPLQPGPKRNRYSCLLPGHVDLSSSVYKDWAVAPWLIILYSPLCLSHKEIYTNGLFQRPCLTYTVAAWVCHCVWLWAQCKVCSYCDLKLNRNL